LRQGFNDSTGRAYTETEKPRKSYSG